MDRHILFIAIMTGLLSAMCQKAAFGDVSTNEQNSDVSIKITKFQVNDQTLELGWKVMNNSDHDVWICDGLTTGPYFDSFLDKDNETLKIMKRSDLPGRQTWEHWPWVKFIRLHPGQDKEDSISLTVPVSPLTKFNHSYGNAEYARRVAVEIGFYNEDLRGLILNIVDLTEQLSCDTSVLSSIVTPDAQILERFFAGVDIAQVFYDKSFGGFRNKVLSDGDEISMPYMDQFLHGEQVLLIEIDGVSIPYKSDYPPLTDEPPQSEIEPAGVTMALTGFDANDTNLELSWKIKNNTDHDVWVCDNITTSYDFDWFLDNDDKTLMIIKRSSLPQGQGWEHWPWVRFIRLRPGQEKDDSVSLTVPVRPYTKFSHLRGNAEYAKCLALEIGFYNEDLRGLILNIVGLAEQLGCDISLSSSIVTFPDAQIPERFFAGVYIARVFHGESFGGFRNSVLSDDDELSMPYMNQFFNGEQVLQLTVDSVSIPYKSNYPPLND